MRDAKGGRGLARWAWLVLFGLSLAPGKEPSTVSQTQNGPLEQFLARAGLAAAAPVAPPPVELVAARQDWKELTADRCCHTLTPLRIGDQIYRKGLGAHANGRALFKLAAPFTRFQAAVGVDHNDDTGGVRGSVEFVVRVDGREVARTPVCRGGEPARAIDVPLLGATELELIVTDGGDGISFDQADWAEARLVAADGQETWLSDTLTGRQPSPFLQPARLPASFVYGGEPSAKLLASWPREDAPVVERDGRRIHQLTWREPGGGLVATWRAEVFLDRPAMECRWTFTNAGTQPTRPLTQWQALDLEAQEGPRQAEVIHSSGGLTGGLLDADLGFEVRRTPLGSLTLAGAGGRSSDRDLPFWVLHDPQRQTGLYVGLGWSGQWQASLRQTGPQGHLAVTAGIPQVNLRLPPGETILGPSVLLGVYLGDAATGTNALRKAVCDHFVPTLAGRRPVAPVSWNSWFVFNNGISDAILTKLADSCADLGLEYFCIDAGWFDGDFPQGVGNWTLNTTKFPHGLRPIGEYVRARGMQLGLWFEPERVAAGTRVGREHPEWVHGDLLDYGQPAAREWVFQMMKALIDDGGVRWIRHDFNTAPLGQWDRADGPDTKGLAQIRHVMGLWSLLDRIRATWPDLLIEGCASGGRRIDLETIKRSHTVWKSDDTSNLPVMRFHQTGGNVLLPGVLLNTNLLRFRTPFDLRSLFGGPLGFGCDWTKLTAADKAVVRRHIADYKRLRWLLDRDYYPLFAQHRDEGGWLGWQFHDPDSGQGFVTLLRPADAPYPAAVVRWRGLDAARSYELTEVGRDDARPVVVPGRELLDGWTVTLAAETAVVYSYRAQ